MGVNISAGVGFGEYGTVNTPLFYVFNRFMDNPTEQVWRWLKPRGRGLPKAVSGGCEGIIS